MWFGWVIFCGSWLALVSTCLLWLVLNCIVIPREERGLEERHKEAYREYVREARRWCLISVLFRPVCSTENSLRGFARPIRMTDWKGHVYERIEISHREHFWSNSSSVAARRDKSEHVCRSRRRGSLFRRRLWRQRPGLRPRCATGRQ